MLKLMLDRGHGHLKVDIVSSDPLGEKSVELVKNYLSEFVLLKPIVLVLKQVLYLSQLTESFKVR